MTLAVAWVVACADTARDTAASRGFLDDCGAGCAVGLSCICGVCTTECTSSAECARVAAGTSCVDTSDSNRSCPAATPAKACDFLCRSDVDCDALSSTPHCDRGRCRATGSARPDASVGDGGRGNGGAASAGGHSGSTSNDSGAGANGDAGAAAGPDGAASSGGLPSVDAGSGGTGAGGTTNAGGVTGDGGAVNTGGITGAGGTTGAVDAGTCADAGVQLSCTYTRDTNPSCAAACGNIAPPSLTVTKNDVAVSHTAVETQRVPDALDPLGPCADVVAFDAPEVFGSWLENPPLPSTFCLTLRDLAGVGATEWRSSPLYQGPRMSSTGSSMEVVGRDVTVDLHVTHLPSCPGCGCMAAGTADDSKGCVSQRIDCQGIACIP